MIRVIFIAMLIACLPSSSTAAQKSCNRPVTAHFEADWWSENQMVGLDPNNPPPKLTRVRLEKWEYSDPIGVPHPDKVILVVGTKCAEPTVKVIAAWVKGAKLRPLPARALGQKRYELQLAPYITDTHPDAVRATISAGGMKKIVVELPIDMGD